MLPQDSRMTDRVRATIEHVKQVRNARSNFEWTVTGEVRVQLLIRWGNTMADDALDNRHLVITQIVPCAQRQTPDSQDSLACASSHSWPAALAPQSAGMASDGGASQVPNRRAGRPVEYQGDINSPLLSQGDRTRIQRRIVNRQAARRLRERQQDTLKHALCKVTELRQSNRQLKEELQDKRAQHKALQEELQQAQADWNPAAAEQEQLQARVHSLRKTLEVGLRLLEQPNQLAKLTPTQYPTHTPPASAQIGSPVLSSSSCEVHQPLHFSGFAPSITARNPLPSHWMSCLAEDKASPDGLGGPWQGSQGISNRAGRLPEALHLSAGHVSGGCSDTARAFSDPGPFSRPDPGAGLFSDLGQFSRSGSFRNPGPFCNSEQGQGSLRGLPSGSSMGSTACPHNSSATIRDYLLSSNGSHDTVSTVYHSPISPNASAAYPSPSPVRQMSQLQATILNSNSHYAHLLPGMDTDAGVSGPGIKPTASLDPCNIRAGAPMSWPKPNTPLGGSISKIPSICTVKMPSSLL
ncbi:hypothetical protein ABBQ38_015383 [Trebouxia sp. C0009 RCD-2024]